MGIPRQSEKAFMATVVAYARLHGWLVYHTRDSRGSAEGYPDLTFARNGVVVFAELKLEGKMPTAEQWKWLGALPHSHLWTPSSWPEIERVLGGKS